MTSNKYEHAWAPLVYARTYSVDYRVIAAPKPRSGYFDDRALARAVQFIQGTFETFTPKDGFNPLRWSMVKNRSYCIVGLTCMVSQLPTDKREDEKGRIGLQAFLGYVLQSDFIAIRMLPDLQTDESLMRGEGPFSLLYQLVENHWEDNLRQSRVIDEFDYKYDLPRGNLDYRRWEDWYLNSNEKKTWVFRATDENNTNLWTIASQMDKPTSLCLGLSAKRMAQSGPFVNASTLDSTGQLGNFEVLPKPQPAPTHPQYQRSPEQDRSRPTEATHSFALPTMPSFKDMGQAFSGLRHAFGGEDEPEADRRIKSNLYEQDKHNRERGGASGRGEPQPHQGPMAGFKPKQRDKERTEALPDPFASESETKSPSRFSDRDTLDRGSERLLSGFKLKSPSQDTKEVLLDPFADSPSKKQKTGELPPISRLKDMKSSPESGSQPSAPAQAQQAQFEQQPPPPNEAPATQIENRPTEPLPNNDQGNA